MDERLGASGIPSVLREGRGGDCPSVFPRAWLHGLEWELVTSVVRGVQCSDHYEGGESLRKFQAGETLIREEGKGRGGKKLRDGRRHLRSSLGVWIPYGAGAQCLFLPLSCPRASPRKASNLVAPRKLETEASQVIGLIGDES